MLILAVSVVTVIFASQQQEQAFAKNILNGLGNAIDQGGDEFSADQDASRNAFRTTGVYDERCTPNAVFYGYMTGYTAGWNALAGSGKERDGGN